MEAETASEMDHNATFTQLLPEKTLLHSVTIKVSNVTYYNAIQISLQKCNINFLKYVISPGTDFVLYCGSFSTLKIMKQSVFNEA